MITACSIAGSFLCWRLSFRSANCSCLRYRVLFNTLLKGADDLEEGLIQEEKSFAGTRRFGMCWVSPVTACCCSARGYFAFLTSCPHVQHAQGTGRGELASIGTALQIQNHHRMDDGRMAVENIGAALCISFVQRQ